LKGSSSIWTVLFPAMGIVKDIRNRIVMGKQAFGNKKRLMTGKMNLDLKKIVNAQYGVCSLWC